MTLALSAVAVIGGSAAPAGPTMQEAQAQVQGEKEVWGWFFGLCLGKCGGPGDDCCGPSVQQA